MKDKIIFLDIDGVLNSMVFISNNEFKHHDLDPNSVRILCEVVKKIDCDIVISSTWRFGGIGPDSQLVSSLLNAGGKEIVDRIIDRTPDLCNELRGDEISKWIVDNNFTGKFCILDDSSDMVDLMPHLIQTSFNVGLTQDIAHKVVDFFKDTVNNN